MKTFVGVQYLRGVAALSVVVFHALLDAGYKESSVTVGLSGGVDVFFVISGFIMWMTTAQRDVTPWDFYRRRIERIVPLYWLMTTVALGAALAAPSLGGQTAFWHVVSSYAFLPSVSPDSGKLEPLVAPGWTLNYEMFFYLVFGVALLMRDRARLVVVTAVLAAFVAAGAAFSPTAPAFRFYTDSIVLEFAFGLLLGVAAQKSRLVPLPGIVALGIVGVTGLAVAGQADFTRAIAFGIPAALIVTAVVSYEPLRSTETLTPARLLGDASYSIYIVHGMVLSAVGAVASKLTLPPAAEVVCGTLAALLAGIVVFQHIERPMLAAMRRRTDPDHSAFAATS